MGTADPAARAAEGRLQGILRGSVQRVNDAWGDVQPQLAPAVAALAAAVRRADADLIAFEYRRTEALNRKLGALLEQIDGALGELEPLADDDAPAVLAGRVARQIRSLGAMKRTLALHLKQTNRREAKAIAAMKAARRRDASFDADWERLRARLAEVVKAIDALEPSMKFLRRRGDSGPARSSVEYIHSVHEAAQQLVARAPQRSLDDVRRAFLKLVDAVVIESAGKDFAAQFRHERAAFEQQLARSAARIEALRAEAAELLRLRVQMSAAMLARAVGA